MSEVTANYDQSWKEALNQYFDSFLSFFFPTIHSLIDWTKTPISLDKELQQITADSDPDLRIVDKLYKVWLLDKIDPFILIHCEVQSQYETKFNKRVYIYNLRAFNLYESKVISLAILGDTRRSWRPAEFSYSYSGIGTGIQFGSIKLLDYESRWDELECSNNPFSLITMAHLKTLATTRNLAKRAEWKWILTQKLYERGLANRDIVKIFNIIDTMMSLPKSLQAELVVKIKHLEEERKMPLISPTIELAKEEGKQELVIKLFNQRFGEIEPSLIKQIHELSSEQLEELTNVWLALATVDDLTQWLQNRPKASK